MPSCVSYFTPALIKHGRCDFEGRTLQSMLLQRFPSSMRLPQSPIRRHRQQRATLIGLGLNRIGRSSLVPDTRATRGMIGRDERLRFRAIDVNGSLSTVGVAREELLGQMKAQHKRPDEDFHQGNAVGAPMDFFAPVASGERLHPNFRTLSDAERYSPARGLVAAMMPFYEDMDGNFVEQFQTTAFDPRIWELYLYATFVELGYALVSSRAVPDFIFRGPLRAVGLEATSINPPNVGEAELPHGEKELPRLHRELHSHSVGPGAEGETEQESALLAK